MKTARIASFLVLALGLFVAQIADAQRVVVRIARPRPVYIAPRPVVYLAPRPVYVAPRRVVVAPRRVYVAPRRVVAPRQVYVVR
ncbi:MAG: hypothetical protein H7Z72_09820 [Bacteroidetes bacterium]|nr:hypothetical protein [Fibrella sp.]